MASVKLSVWNEKEFKELAPIGKDKLKDLLKVMKSRDGFGKIYSSKKSDGTKRIKFYATYNAKEKSLKLDQLGIENIHLTTQINGKVESIIVKVDQSVNLRPVVASVDKEMGTETTDNSKEELKTKFYGVLKDMGVDSQSHSYLWNLALKDSNKFTP